LRAEAHHGRDGRSVGFGARGSDFAGPPVGRLSPPYDWPKDEITI